MPSPARRVLRAIFLLWALAASAAAWAQTKNAAPERDELTIDAAAITESRTGDLAQMIERRMVRVLVVPNRTFYFTDRGRQRGATYDAFQIVEQELNKRLQAEKKLPRKNVRVKFFFIPIGRDEIFSALAEGRGDIAAANLTITPARQQLVDFAAPIASNVSEVIVTGPASPPVATLDDLSGREIFVRKSSSYYEHLVELNRRFAARNKPPARLVEAPDELENEDLIEMLNAGLVPLIVVDKPIATFWKKIFPKISPQDAMTINTGGDIAWAVRKGSPQLKGFLDEMATEFVSGPLADERAVILARYLKKTKYVTDAASTSNREKFVALIDLFKKYGDQYDVDYLLMAAQGYQESTLNQSLRSRRGAVGVMQIMPATGRELKVGDISKVEPNVHAGVKYMRFMIDQYFGDEPMTPLDKALFSFASYNAGPSRIRQLRQEAARRGYDPNVWFGNVEHIADERIGHETVTYVGNIYKYYVAYRLLIDTMEDRQKARDTLTAN